MAAAVRVVAVVAAVAGVLAPGPSPRPAAAAPAPAVAEATASRSHGAIRPGASLRTPRGQCTANVVFTDGADLYLGLSAHCLARGLRIDGCGARTLPIGTAVRVAGARYPARLAYSSWEVMTRTGERRRAVCWSNDFALVRLDRRDHGRVDPTVPHWGGPTGVRRGGPAALSFVYGFGASRLRQGLDLLAPKLGISLGPSASGWLHSVYVVTPGIPGDSGSVLLDARGRAVGVLRTLMILPLPLSNQYTDLGRALAYARDRGGIDVQVVTGRERFRPHAVPVAVG